ncbi:MAG: magnesium transporter [Alphaproteobacteria bacterium]|nr:MAG: magnesium transporter [Alphaproteobacteria bacterium]
MSQAQEEIRIRDEEGALDSEFVSLVIAAIEDRDKRRLKTLCGDLHDADLADLIESLRPEQRSFLIDALGKALSPAALSELEEPVRDQVLESMPTAEVARAVRKLDVDDAVYLLEDLDEEEQEEILAKLPKEERIALERSLEYPEDSAGRLMQTAFIAVPPFWTVGQTIDYLREDDDLPNSFSEIYVVDADYHLLGAVPLDRLLRTKRPVKIEAITEKEIHPIEAEMDQEETARIFERYNLLSAPVVDENGRIVGVIMVDDIVDVIQEEAEEDIHRLGGVGDESVTDSVWRITRGRFVWLLVNLGTALLASWVISLFDATIQQMVALAVLMPVVASMGGNAATQTMTVAVRALATRELGAVNMMRVIFRECAVGFLNGLLFALIMGVVAYFWFGSDQLGLVIAVAMVINMFVAGLSGILIPVILDHADIDPAIASGVFVTTVTDVIGFFAFLGLASIWLI